MKILILTPCHLILIGAYQLRQVPVYMCLSMLCVCSFNVKQSSLAAGSYPPATHHSVFRCAWWLLACHGYHCCELERSRHFENVQPWGEGGGGIEAVYDCIPTSPPPPQQSASLFPCLSPYHCPHSPREGQLPKRQASAASSIDGFRWLISVIRCNRLNLSHMPHLPPLFGCPHSSKIFFPY